MIGDEDLAEVQAQGSDSRASSPPRTRSGGSSTASARRSTGSTMSRARVRASAAWRPTTTPRGRAIGGAWSRSIPTTSRAWDTKRAPSLRTTPIQRPELATRSRRRHRGPGPAVQRLGRAGISDREPPSGGSSSGSRASSPGVVVVQLLGGERAKVNASSCRDTQAPSGVRPERPWSIGEISASNSTDSSNSQASA